MDSPKTETAKRECKIELKVNRIMRERQRSVNSIVTGRLYPKVSTSTGAINRQSAVRESGKGK